MKTKILSMYDDTVSVEDHCDEPTMAQQQFKEECDINNIMKKFAVTGAIDHVSNIQAQYGDFSNVGTYHDALIKVQEAQDSFMSLDASIRKEFSNDPVQLMNFLADPNNKQKAIDLGLIPKEQAAAPAPAPAPSPSSTPQS